jgi:hypothetical protein
VVPGGGPGESQHPEPDRSLLETCAPVVASVLGGAMRLLDRREAARAFQQPFASTPALGALWNEAATGSESFERARERFWKAVNHGTTDSAKVVRALVLEAGYRLRGGSAAPVLALGPDEEPVSGRDRSERLLTIDHLDPQSRARDQLVDVANLRFMTGMDNSRRGHRWTPSDQPVNGWERWRKRTVRLTKERREYEQRLRARLASRKAGKG